MELVLPTVGDLISTPKEFSVVSTFTGGGGSCMGTMQAGGDVVGALEFCDNPYNAYTTNFPSHRMLLEDIRKVTAKDILGDFKGELDVFEGSPPCSDFSTAGKGSKSWGKVKNYSNKKQRVDDLFFEYIRLLNELKPKVFVAENVKGLAMGDAKVVLGWIISDMRKCGYVVKVKILKGENLGIPQTRHRCIFVGVREDIWTPDMENKTHPTPEPGICTVANALEGVYQDEGPAFKEMEGRQILQYVSKCRQGEKASKYHPKGHSFNTIRLNWRKPCPTMTQALGSGGLFHPAKDRLLTIPEIKRLQTIPDDYVATGSTFARQWELIGRMVPPRMMYKVMDNVKRNILKIQ